MLRRNAKQAVQRTPQRMTANENAWKKIFTS